MADEFADTVLSQVTGYETLEEMQAAFEEATRELLENLEEADQEHADKVAELMEETGDNAEDMEETINDALDRVEEGLANSEEAVTEMSNTFNEELNSVMEIASAFQSAWATVTDNIVSNASKQAQAIYDLAQEYRNLNAAINDQEYTYSTYSASGSGTSGSGSSGTNNTDEDDALVDTTTYTVRVDTDAKLITRIYNTNAVRDYSKLTKAQIQELLNKGYSLAGSYDTGGYTGEWGTTDGKLAFLHQKELVLNATDTENILAAVNSVRNLFTGVHGLTSSITPANAAEVGALEQNVHIEASFPNATDKDEITAAFEDLVNLAAQYAARKE